ncbi:MAG: DUF932 domain-containing protein [Erysipelotrichales bacterium]|jgi:phage/plasmid-like protein (TIGR03299 family)|nr:MAG: DUF932 domain-containing protein [Erysipelotrichales bacterium]
MAHMIDMSNYRENMVYVGATPWHHLGTQFTGDETFEEWRVAAGFNWEAQKKDLVYKATHAAGHEVDVILPSHKALVRSDTEMVLSVVGKDYKIVQPKDVLEFFREIAFASGGRYTMETAGCLSDGKRIWALAKIDDEMRVGGIDVIKPYILFGTSFDLSTSTYASYTTVRVVCNNTLQAAIGTAASNADVRITHAQTYDEDSVKRALGLLEGAEESAFDGFIDTANLLTTRKVNDFETFNYFAELYGPKRNEGQSVNDLKISDFTTGQKRNIDQLIRLFKQGPGANMKTASGTAWGLVNAVTHFEDFSHGKNDMKRLQSSAFGSGKRNKLASVNTALALVA